MNEAPVYPYAGARASGLFKSRCEDFQVDEELGFEADGDGEHCLVLVEKRNLSTAELIERIARDTSVPRRDIGYCGLKDKQALTRQWLSLQLAGKPDPRWSGDGDGYRVLDQRRHRRKLRPGIHRRNRFRVRLRELEGYADEAAGIVDQVSRFGFANYFGAQRFGSQQNNVGQALSRLGDRRLPRSRRGIYISALRSHLFNQILSRRVSEGHWRAPLAGDVFMLRGSHSIFSAPLDETLRRRFEALDIASTASLYGNGPSRLDGEALHIEQQVFRENGEITACLDRLGVKRQMRPLRVALDAFDYEYDAASACLRLELRLPAGSYLTSLLAHFVDAQESF